MKFKLALVLFAAAAAFLFSKMDMLYWKWRSLSDDPKKGLEQLIRLREYQESQGFHKTYDRETQN